MVGQGGGGSIINITSQLAEVARPERAAYVASKGGARSLTHAMAVDLAAHGIRVNAIAPGWVITERQRTHWVTDEALSAHVAKQCIREVMKPEDLVGPCLFLASDASLMLTAQTLIVDGGYL